MRSTNKYLLFKFEDLSYEIAFYTSLGFLTVDQTEGNL